MENLLRRIQKKAELLAEIKKIALNKEELESVEQLEISTLVALYGDKFEVIDLEIDEKYYSGAKMSLLRFTQSPTIAFVVFAKEQHISNYYQLHLVFPGFKSRGYTIPYCQPASNIKEVCREKGIKRLIVENHRQSDWRLSEIEIQSVSQGSHMREMISVSYTPD